MGIPDFFSDSPISVPEEDRFGIDPFARALASSFSGISSPVGATIALNGPWGSGKSSAVNLIRHHLRSNANDDTLAIIDFKCWWFHGEEALTLAFFQTLNSALSKSLGDKAKELIPKIGKKLLQAGPVVGPAINLATGGIWGAVTSGSLDFTKRFFPEDESVEALFRRLSEALEGQQKRFLVIIDDIDRLTPDEALLIFRLVKSVGRLPKRRLKAIFADSRRCAGTTLTKFSSSLSGSSRSPRDLLPQIRSLLMRIALYSPGSNTLIASNATKSATLTSLATGGQLIEMEFASLVRSLGELR